MKETLGKEVITIYWMTMHAYVTFTILAANLVFPPPKQLQK